jgi:hypothetical protein
MILSKITLKLQITVVQMNCRHPNADAENPILQDGRVTASLLEDPGENRSIVL